MMFNRMELIDRLRSMVKEREDQAAEKKEQKLQEVADEARQYVLSTAEEWKVFVRVIQAQLRKNNPITPADIPPGLRDRYNGIRLFEKKRVDESSFIPRTTHLNTMITVLEASTDEFISDAALSRLGVPLKDLVKS